MKKLPIPHDFSATSPLLQDRTNFRVDQVDLFAVAAGPGSFTGLRVGLTAVKAWAEVHEKPIAAISGLEAIAAESLAAQATVASNTQFIAPFLDARRGQLFGAIYRRISGDVDAAGTRQRRVHRFGRRISPNGEGKIRSIHPTGFTHSGSSSARSCQGNSAGRVDPASVRRPWRRRLGGWDLNGPSAAIWSIPCVSMPIMSAAPTPNRPGRMADAIPPARKSAVPQLSQSGKCPMQTFPPRFPFCRKVPEAATWSRASLLESASSGIALAAEVDGRVAGILIGRVVADEFEILNLAVGQSKPAAGHRNPIGARRCPIRPSCRRSANLSGSSRVQRSRNRFLRANGIPRLRTPRKLLS